MHEFAMKVSLPIRMLTHHSLYIFYGKDKGNQLALELFNPLTAMSDQDRISPYNIKTISIRQVIRVKKNISLRIF